MMLFQSTSLYKKLQKRYSRKINLDLKRIKKVLIKLDYPHLSLPRPINILGSDGKASVLTSIKYFLEANGEVEAIVKTAHKLSSSLEKKVKTFIMKEFNAKDVELTSHIDSTLVGSLLLEVDGKQIDWSVHSQLNKFKEQF